MCISIESNLIFTFNCTEKSRKPLLCISHICHFSIEKDDKYENVKVKQVLSISFKRSLLQKKLLYPYCYKNISDREDINYY